jgi:hypothetical protein
MTCTITSPLKRHDPIDLRANHERGSWCGLPACRLARPCRDRRVASASQGPREGTVRSRARRGQVYARGVESRAGKERKWAVRDSRRSRRSRRRRCWAARGRARRPARWGRTRCARAKRCCRRGASATPPPRWSALWCSTCPSRWTRRRVGWACLWLASRR